VRNITFDALNRKIIVPVSGEVDGENFLGKYYFVDGGKFRVYGVFPSSGDTFVRIIGTPVTTYETMEIVSTPDGYTPLGTSYTKGVTVYDYTNKKVWYEPCQNEKDDPYKGLSVIPQNPRFIVSFKGRLYMSGSGKDDDNVFLSDAGNPFYFPPALPLQLPPNSDKVTGMAVYDDSVLIGREEDIHVITGATNNPSLGLELFEIRKLNTHTGFANNRCVNIVHNFLFFVGSDGNAYTMNNVRGGIKVLSTSQLNKSVDFMAPPFNLKREDLLTSVTCFHDNKWYLSVKDFVFMFFYESGAWTVLDNLKARSFYVKDYELIWGSELRGIDTGLVFKFSNDYKDDGKPFLAYWESGNLDMDDPSTFKHFRDVFIVAFMYSGYESDIRVSFELDYADVAYSFSIANQVAKWGISKWGDKYSARPVNPSLPFTIGRRARTIKMRFANGMNVKGTYTNRSELDTINIKENEDTYYVSSEDLYYSYDALNSVWVSFTLAKLAQPMRVLQINGEYELRGKR
jgi:hypothetical protein